MRVPETMALLVCLLLPGGAAFSQDGAKTRSKDGPRAASESGRNPSGNPTLRRTPRTLRRDLTATRLSRVVKVTVRTFPITSCG